MNDDGTSTTADVQAHPVWCDPGECTWRDNGGAHRSAWMKLGPLSETNLVVRSYLYATKRLPEPTAMISFHHPIVDPEDIAINAGREEDTNCFVLPIDEVQHLHRFFGQILAVSNGTQAPEAR